MDPLFEDDSLIDLMSDDLEGTAADHLVDSSIVEDCLIEGQHLSLPVGLCEDPNILLEMLNPESLREVLSPDEVQHLRTYLPDFGSGSEGESERDKSWNMLFTNQNLCFGNPVQNFARQLQIGWFNPDIARTRKLYLRARRKIVKREQRNYYFNLLPKVIVSRQQLIDTASQLPPDHPVHISPPVMTKKPATIKSLALNLDERVRKRYFDELRAIDCLSSDDESYPEGPLPSLSKKQRRHLSSVQTSLGEFKPIQSTFTRINPGNQSLLAVEQPKLQDDEQSAPVPGGVKVTASESKRTEPVVDVLSKVCGSKNVYEVTEEAYRLILNQHRVNRREGKIPPSLEVPLNQIRLEDVGHRIRAGPTMANRFHRAVALPPPAPVQTKLPTESTLESRSKKNKDGDSESFPSSVDEADSENEAVRKPAPKIATKPSAPRVRKSTKPKAKESKLSESASGSIAKILDEVIEAHSEPADLIKDDLVEPLTNLPHSPASTNRNPTPTIPPVSLTQDTYSSFFALVREVMLNSDGPVSAKHLVEALNVWNSSPIAPLNEWYCQLMVLHQRMNGWSSVIQSALEFLLVQRLISGSDPAYVWDAQGKDNDLLLQDLSLNWTQNQPSLENGHDEKIDVEASSDLNDSLTLPGAPDNALNNLGVPGAPLGLGIADMTADEATDAVSSTFLDPSDVVLPPRSVTSWVVRPSTAEERIAYQDQERQRYSQPHRAFTFRQHGYEGVVGPVKGVYSPTQGVGTPGTKVRGHNLMVQERPACVTLLSLVRDAAARLPNGEGTRADICELMKDSQFLATGAEASLHSVVSGALDRLHYEADPCVKYDSTRKVWIYLHRHRTEAEFEQLHKQHQGLPSRVKKPRSEHRNRSAASANAGSNTVGQTPAKVAKNLTNPVASPPANPSTTGSVAAVEIPSPSSANPVNVQTVASSARVNSATTLVPGIVKLNCADVAAIRSQQQDASKTASSQSSSTVPPAVSTVTTSPSTSGATIQTFQITTSTGVQTIRVAAPSNLPTAFLARTLQLSAQQHGVVAQGQKITVSSGSVNGTSAIKQVILSPSSALSKAVPTTLLAHPRPATIVTSTATPAATSVATSSTASVVQVSVPVTSSPVAGTSPGPTTPRARLPASPVRLVNRQAVTTTTGPTGSPVQTFLIRPPTPSTSSPGTVSAPRLVMVNNKLINLGSTPVVHGGNRIIRPGGHVALATTAAGIRKPGPGVTAATGGTGARPVLARVVAGSTQQQQVITLENLLSLAANPQNKTVTKGPGVVQLPLSAIAGLNVAGGTSGTPTSTGTSQPTTVLLQNVKGGQSILLPAGFQGGTINIRGIRLSTVAGQTGTGGTGQPKQTFVARLVTPTQQISQQANTQQPSPQPKNAD